MTSQRGNVVVGSCLGSGENTCWVCFLILRKVQKLAPPGNSST